MVVGPHRAKSACSSEDSKLLQILTDRAVNPSLFPELDNVTHTLLVM